ncbi:MAG: ATP-binding protein [Cyanobacteria bacterium P01_D01_bin.50]
MKTTQALALTGIGLSLISAFYLGINKQNFNAVRVSFCPKTANIYQKNYRESQLKLDNKYCRYQYTMLKEVWEDMQRDTRLPLPKGSFQVLDLPAKTSSHIWYLVAPISAFVGYIAYSKYVENVENDSHENLEEFKTRIKLTGVKARLERKGKEETIQRQVDKKRMEAGFISADGLQQQYDEHSEIHSAQHKSALKTFELNNSEMDKHIAENLRDKAKADKERVKIEGKKSFTAESRLNPQQELINSMVDALKQHEDGWLWTLIESVKPIFLIGEQGSAKTSMAVAIAIIREALGHRVQKIADRHLHGENSDKWNLLKSELKYDNDSSILEMLSASIEERIENIARLPKDYHQVLMDEFTQLAQIEPKKTSKAIVERFVTSTYSDCRKAHELFIGVTHSFTNATFGDGVYELRKKGWLIEKFATVKGDKPLPRICIRIGMKNEQGNLLTDVEKTLPNWFRPEIINSHLQGKKIIEF